MEFISTTSDTWGKNVIVHVGCDDKGWSGAVNWTTKNSVKAAKLLLAACGLFGVAASETRAATELPGITVIGKATPPGDFLSRDRDHRPPNILWSPVFPLNFSTVFPLTNFQSIPPSPTP